MTVRGIHRSRPPGARNSGRVLLVLGASGQLGRQVVDGCSDNPEFSVVAASRATGPATHRFRLEDATSIDRLIHQVAPDHVVLAAAATNVAWCETHPDEAHEINVEGPAAVAKSARASGATVTFISTDYVFDGANGPYGELDSPAPLNIYGATKLEAEGAVLASSDSNLVIRTCQVFGADSRRANFVLRVVDRLRGGETVEASDDLYGTPTFAPDLAAEIVALTGGGVSGIRHVVGHEFVSRFALARRVARAFDLPGDKIVDIKAIALDDGVARPRRSGLVSNQPPATGVDRMRSLDDALGWLAEQEVPT